MKKKTAQFELWMLNEAFQVTSLLPPKPEVALALIEKATDYVLGLGEKIFVNDHLPADGSKALSVLALSRQIVIKVMTPYCLCLRRGAARKPR